MGVTFRLNACEQSLRSHNDEMAAQRLMLQQLADAVTKLNSEKETTEGRLNQVFGLVDQKFAEAQSNTQEIFSGSKERFEVMSATVQSIASQVMQGLDKINKDIEMLKMTSQSPRPEPAFPGTHTAAPPPPTSWTGVPTNLPGATFAGTDPRPSQSAPTAGNGSGTHPSQPSQTFHQ